MFSFTISTKRQIELIDITDKVGEIVVKSGVKEGVCLVYVPHATAAIIINEFEPNIAQDYLEFFEKFVPKGPYKHNMIDDNAEAHMKSAFFGAGKCIPVSGGKIALGTWQSIILCEFDGPRTRTVHVQVASC
ncbi:MAG: secondary thiamine-phosphate synthase enzyme YjbQ [Candidatus Micrarchaeia archaeon]